MSNAPHTTEQQLYSYAEEFRALAETAWSAETSFFGEYDPSNPSRGQCGVSSIGLGLWLNQQKGVAKARMQYERGILFDVAGRALGTNHSWLRMYYEGHEWRMDVTADQYDQYDPQAEPVEPVIVQAVGGVALHSVHHYAEKHTLLAEYDHAKLASRLAIFAERIDIDV